MSWSQGVGINNFVATKQNKNHCFWDKKKYLKVSDKIFRRILNSLLML